MSIEKAHDTSAGGGGRQWDHGQLLRVYSQDGVRRQGWRHVAVRADLGEGAPATPHTELAECPGADWGHALSGVSDMQVCGGGLGPGRQRGVPHARWGKGHGMGQIPLGERTCTGSQALHSAMDRAVLSLRGGVGAGYPQWWAHSHKRWGQPGGSRSWLWGRAFQLPWVDPVIAGRPCPPGRPRPATVGLLGDGPEHPASGPALSAVDGGWLGREVPPQPLTRPLLSVPQVKGAGCSRSGLPPPGPRRASCVFTTASPAAR